MWVKRGESKTKEKFKRRRNFKPRQNVVVDTSEQEKIRVLLPESEYTQCDDSNALVLPGGKRPTKKTQVAAPARLLSKKQRKRLQKIVDTKKKKANREETIAALEEMHAVSKKQPQFVSLQTTQTLGRKKYLKEVNTEAALLTGHQHLETPMLSTKRKRGPQHVTAAKRRKQLRDPSIVYCNPSSSDTSSDSEDDDDIAINVENDLVKDSIICEHDKAEKETHQSDSDNECSAAPVTATTTTSATATNTPTTASTASVTVSAADKAQSVFVAVARDAAMAEARQELPILAEEQTVMEAIRQHQMTVIVGPTGSGKTTQVPQFLYEAGYASQQQIIGVTEPRRVAAVAMAERVGKELGLSSREVSYQIRFEGNTTADTKIKFMTDGVLLKEFQTDHMLLKYSAIIIDEAHERSVYSDMLIGILSRVVPARHKKGNPLKLIVMSATLKVDDFTANTWLVKKMEAPPPVIKIEGRMFDVTVHYNRKTEDDYVGVAYNKVCKIHRQLPEGAILVFVTGQKEVNTLCRQLSTTFPRLGSDDTDAAPVVSAYRTRITELKQRRKEAKERNKQQGQQEEEAEDAQLTKHLLDIKVDQFAAAASVFPDNENEASDSDESDNEGDKQQAASNDFELGEDGGDGLRASKRGEQPLYVLPLYSLLPAHRQKMVFDPPPAGMRLCVVATNVAETSLTIPDVKYVVDCGKTKDKVYDKVTGVSMFHVARCSQASAQQRAGRAGRVAPGHCYRLYSSAVFNELPEFAKAEILCRPIDDVILILKNLCLPVVNFPYPTPPDHVQIRQSLKRLTCLGALQEKEASSRTAAQSDQPLQRDTTAITDLGRLMSSFPVAPRYAKMLCLSDQYQLWPYTVALVAALTVQEILVEMPLDSAGSEFDARRSEWRKVRLAWSGTSQRRQLGDLMVLLAAVLEAEKHGNTQAYCDQYGLRQKGLLNIRKLRRQLTNEVNMIVPDSNISLDPYLKPPSMEQCYALRQIVLSGSVDRVARRVDTAHLKEAADKKRWKHAYRTVELEDPVYLPSSSVLKIDKPEWVVYQDIFETNKMFMRGVTAIEPEWLTRFAPLLCTFSEPLSRPAPYYDGDSDAVMCYREATYGRADWSVPRCLVPHPDDKDLYCRFAFHLLKGDVLATLAPMTCHLLDINTLVRPLALRFLKQREGLTRALRICGVASRAKLLRVWEKKPQYLKEEYCMWLLDPEHRTLVNNMWPPLPKVANEWVV